LLAVDVPEEEEDEPEDDSADEEEEDEDEEEEEADFCGSFVSTLEGGGDEESDENPGM
jgi:hypothetical protein